MTEPGRDRYVDFLRSFSLVVVVIWHWMFTILAATPESITSTNPIGFNRWLWVGTWLLQVMPVFFFVGGYTHHRAFADYVPGDSRRFLRRRLGRLLLPSAALIAAWVGIGWILEAAVAPGWTWSAVLLVLFPLWFLVIYVMLVLLAPLAIRAHWRWGELVLVWLLGLAGVLDVLRFAQGQGWAAWVNFLVIWGLAHQLGFFYERLAAAPARTAWMMFWGGLFGLVALTNMGFYPRSLVGVTGEGLSNMGPPTLVIVAFTFLQVGLVLLIRPRVLAWLEEGPMARCLLPWMTRNSLPLYLFHTTGMAAALAVLAGFGYLPPPSPNLEWWLTRPLWLAAPALATWPLLWLYGKLAPSPKKALR